MSIIYAAEKSKKQVIVSVSLKQFLLPFFENLKQEESQHICQWFFNKAWSKTHRPTSIFYQILKLDQYQVLLEFMAFSEPHCLQLGTNYLERMSDRGCQHSGSYSRYYLIDALGLQLLIEHVVEATKGALFDAAGKCATEESFGSLSFIDVHSCFSDRVVSMKICQLKASFDNIEGVGQKGTDESRNRRCEKVLMWCHLCFFEITKACEVKIATESCFITGSNKPFIVSLYSIFFVDVFA